MLVAFLAEDVPAMRRCSLCGVLKSVDEFHRRGDGSQWWCKECRRAWDAKYYATTSDLRGLQRRERGERLVARMRVLKENPCVDCGGRFHPAAMTFGHRPGTKKVNDLATLAISGCTGLFEEELSKCDLVCSNCHAVRTYLRRVEARVITRRLPVLSTSEVPAAAPA
jgi:hypothetical protein